MVDAKIVGLQADKKDIVLPKSGKSSISREQLGCGRCSWLGLEGGSEAIAKEE